MLDVHKAAAANHGRLVKQTIRSRLAVLASSVVYSAAARVLRVSQADRAGFNVEFTQHSGRQNRSFGVTVLGSSAMNRK